MAEAVRVACPECSKTYSIRPELLGKKSACKACGEQFVLKLSGPSPTVPPPLPSANVVAPSGPPNALSDEHTPGPEKPKGFFGSLRAAVRDAAAAGAAAAKEVRDKQAKSQEGADPPAEKKSFREKWTEHQEKLAEMRGDNCRSTDLKAPPANKWMLVKFCGCSLSSDFGLTPKENVFAYCAESALILRKMKGFSLSLSVETTQEVLRVPLTEVEELTVETADRMTLGRIGAGYLLAGPFGALIGGLWKKQDKFLRVDWAGKHSIVFGKAMVDAETLKQRVVEGVRQVREANGEPPGGVPNLAAPTADAKIADVTDAIAKLAALRDQGILTDDEFSAKKAELLSRM